MGLFRQWSENSDSLLSRSEVASSYPMAGYPGKVIPGFVRKLRGQDGVLTFDEAVGQVL